MNLLLMIEMKNCSSGGTDVFHSSELQIRWNNHFISVQGLVKKQQE
jgi:hypothetical protein